jgi:hypothetical protein
MLSVYQRAFICSTFVKCASWEKNVVQRFERIPCINSTMEKNNVQNSGKILNDRFVVDQKEYMEMLYFSLRQIKGPVSFEEAVNSYD